MILQVPLHELPSLTRGLEYAQIDPTAVSNEKYFLYPMNFFFRAHVHTFGYAAPVICFLDKLAYWHQSGLKINGFRDKASACCSS